MKKLITISLLANIAILIPVCIGLGINSEQLAVALGGATPARGILLSIYFSILAASALLLMQRGPKPVAALLLVQIIYKVTTPFTVGTLQNPVVISNLVIAALHIITLFFIYRTVGNPFRSEGVINAST
jgi:uncharacterized membrane protein (DUF441 family)